MKHYREFFDNEFLHSHELKDKDVTVRIKVIVKEGLTMQGGIQNEKMVIEFDKASKKLICNKTNAELIAEALKETDTDKWIGQEITLYPTQCKLKGKQVDCIRVRVQKGSL